MNRKARIADLVARPNFECVRGPNLGPRVFVQWSGREMVFLAESGMKAYIDSREVIWTATGFTYLNDLIEYRRVS